MAMTPKEKAVELYNNYKETLNIRHDMRPVANPFAKKCALIAVDEIIKAIDFDWMEVQNLDRQYNYWVEVKEEIERL